MTKVLYLTSDCDEGIYIDGKLVYQYSHLYITDLLDALKEAGVITYKKINVDERIEEFEDERGRIVFPPHLDGDTL
jgi:hypothetical protein